MKRKKKISLVRVTLTTQIAAFALVIWFAFYSTSMSCQRSGNMAAFVIIAYTINCLLLLLAIMIERDWRRIAFPFIWYFLGLLIVTMTMH